MRNFFDKYTEIWQKVTNIIIKDLIELIFTKIYLKAEKKLTQKNDFIVFVNE